MRNRADRQMYKRDQLLLKLPASSPRDYGAWRSRELGGARCAGLMIAAKQGKRHAFQGNSGCRSLHPMNVCAAATAVCMWTMAEWLTVGHSHHGEARPSRCGVPAGSVGATECTRTCLLVEVGCCQPETHTPHRAAPRATSNPAWGVPGVEPRTPLHTHLTGTARCDSSPLKPDEHAAMTHRSDSFHSSDQLHYA